MRFYLPLFFALPLLINWLEKLSISENAKTSLQLKLGALQAIGIGIINAMIFLTQLEDINRFKTFDPLSSYVGLKPDILFQFVYHCHKRYYTSLQSFAERIVGRKRLEGGDKRPGFIIGL